MYCWGKGQPERGKNHLSRVLFSFLSFLFIFTSLTEFLCYYEFVIPSWKKRNVIFYVTTGTKSVFAQYRHMTSCDSFSILSTTLIFSISSLIHVCSRGVCNTHNLCSVDFCKKIRISRTDKLRYFGAFAYSLTASISVIISVLPTVCLSVRVYRLGSPWTGFRDVWCWRLPLKTVDKTQICLKAEKNTRHFAWKHKYNWLLPVT
jgi:hypothetical protein